MCWTCADGDVVVAVECELERMMDTVGGEEESAEGERRRA